MKCTQLFITPFKQVDTASHNKDNKLAPQHPPPKKPVDADTKADYQDEDTPKANLPQKPE